MIISVETATKSLDYDWYSESGSKGDARPRTVITENSASFAFYAERNNGGWSATILNLWIPEQKDQNGRRIRLSVRFDELESEAQARALALAYLALPLEKISSFRYARYSAELAECYGVAEDGSPVLQFDKMKQWAESAIARADLTKPCTPASSACFAEIDKSAITEIGELQSHLRTYALRDKNGMRILFDDGYVEGLETDVDIIITICDTGTRIEHTPFAQATAKKADAEKKSCPALDFAIGLREKAKSCEITKKIKDHDLAKKLIAGCVVLGILFVVSFQIWSTSSKTCQKPLIVQTSIKPADLKFRIENASREKQTPNSEEMKILPPSASDCGPTSGPKELKLQIPDTPAGEITLEIQNEPTGCSLMLNGKKLNKGADGKYSLPNQGGILQILQPKS